MKVLDDTRVVFAVSILAALTAPQLAKQLEWMIIPALMSAMTLSLTQLRHKNIWDPKTLPQSIAACALNWAVLSSIIFIGSSMLIEDPHYLAGLVVMACVPPAVAVVPFTFLSGGNMKITTQAHVISYLLSLILTPTSIWLLLGGKVDITYLVQLMAFLILVPMIASQALIKAGNPLNKHTKKLVNLSFAPVTYVLIGLNQPQILSDPLGLWPVFTVLVLRTFVVGTIVYYTTRGLGRVSVTYTLFSSYKNNGLAAALALSILSPMAALPMAFAAFLEPLFIVYFLILVKRYRF